MASWYGTDVFVEQYKNRANIGGYFSYVENNVPKCVFFSKEENARVIGTVSFDETYDTKTAKTQLTERTFSDVESELYIIRKKALTAMEHDTIFKTYKGTNLNLVPIITNGEKKVYVLTGPTKNGEVIFGNDYLLTFDKKNNLKSTKRLHTNIITIKYEGKGEKGVAAVHSHLPETGDIITATDICTTMLYEKFAGWETNYVMSENYVSIWDCKSNELVVMTRKAFDKIAKD